MEPCTDYSLKLHKSQLELNLDFRVKHLIKKEVTKHPIISCSKKENSTKKTLTL